MSDASKRTAPPIESEIDLHAEQTRLTNRLIRIEEYLGGLPWKSSTLIKFRGDGSRALSFERHESKWRLIVYDVNYQSYGEASFDHGTLVRDSSVDVQSEVAALLPVLIENMRAQFDIKSQAVKAGHAALDELEKQLSGGGITVPVEFDLPVPAVRKAGKAGS